MTRVMATPPMSLPAISSMGDTADSSTSTTRVDFSSIIEVSMVWPPLMTPMNIRIMNAMGSIVLSPPTVSRSASGPTVVDRGRGTRSRASSSLRSSDRAATRASTMASRTLSWMKSRSRSSSPGGTNRS